MTALPLILIGPVLRRVEPRLVSVFVATSRRSTIRLVVYDGLVDAANPPAEHSSDTSQTLAFGTNFHATVVTVEISDANVLLPGHRYSYDLLITPDGGEAQSLKALELLSDSTLPAVERAEAGTPSSEEVEVCSLGYADGQLPSFMTCPETLDDLVLAHASCRKPHGEGRAALQSIDQLIDDLHGAEAGVPHMLFLTGDQIYADDVAAALLPGINSLAKMLIFGEGGVEQVPSPVAGGPFNVDLAALPTGFRQKLLGSAGFTGESSASHLVGFGEWLAMYCLAWNPTLWPVLAVADVSEFQEPAALRAQLLADAAHSPAEAPLVLGRPGPQAATAVITPLYGPGEAAMTALHGAMKDFLPAKAALDGYRREVPKVRRLLANVPTYMICDDHEVTDDWFMTGAIRAQTTGNAFGRALVRNALAACVVCQSWGNDPLRWRTEAPRRALLTALTGLYGTGLQSGLPDAAASAALDRSLGLSPDGVPEVDFSFTVDGPLHRVRGLDTRTCRQYSTAYAAPGLLTPEALDRQLPEEDLPDGHVLIVISPAPVFGPAVMNEIGGIMAATAYDVASFTRAASKRSGEQNVTGLPDGRPLGVQFFDAEHWSAHPAAFERLLDRLSHYPRVVVLAGDVHYGCAYAMDWSGSGRTSRIIHFTASAAKNAWAGVVRNLMLLNGMSVGLQRLGMPMTRLGWTATLPSVVDDLSNEPPLPRIRASTGPVLLSDELFQHRHSLTRAPDWLWRSDPVVDTRAPAERPAAARVQGLDTDLQAGAAAVHDYGRVAAAHVSGLNTVAVARGLQFLNNVGVVRFGRSGEGLHVSQSLYSLRARPEPNESSDAYIVYETSLEPAALAVPATIGQEG